jgi:hypothetical protein
MNEPISAAGDGPNARVDRDPRFELARCAQFLLLVVFSGLTGVWLARGPALTGESASLTAALRTGIDPNHADWYELAQLPGVGEALARRIVAFRDAEQDRRKDRRVFSRPADLVQVRGIGEKTVRRLGAFLQMDARGAPPIVDRAADGG